MSTNGNRPRFSNAAAHAVAEQRDATFEYELSNTKDPDGNPYVVLARIPDPTDVDALMHLPQPLQEAMFRDIDQVDNEGLAPGETATPEGDVARALELIRNNQNVVNFYLCAGFIDPKCYLDKAEADANDGVWVQSIHSLDRVAFMGHCVSDVEVAAEAVAPFREEPTGPVDRGPDGPAVRGSGRPGGSKRGARHLAAVPGVTGS
jgi:hypothetical protein